MPPRLPAVVHARVSGEQVVAIFPAPGTSIFRGPRTFPERHIRTVYPHRFPWTTELQVPYPAANGTSSVSFYNAGESYDTAGFHDDNNPTRLTVPVDGKYLIYAWVLWDTDFTGSRYAGLSVNGVSREAQSSEPVSIGTSHSIATHANLVAGDYIQLQVFQKTGGTLNVQNASFGMVKTP